MTKTSSSEEGYVSSVDYSRYLHKERDCFDRTKTFWKCENDDDVLDVISEGSYISKGEKIRVVKIEGMRIIVRKI